MNDFRCVIWGALMALWTHGATAAHTVPFEFGDLGLGMPSQVTRAVRDMIGDVIDYEMMPTEWQQFRFIHMVSDNVMMVMMGSVMMDGIDFHITWHTMSLRRIDRP